MLYFALEAEFFGPPDIVALPGVETLALLGVHVKVHLVLQHNVYLVFELGYARHIFFHLGIPTGFLKD